MNCAGTSTFSQALNECLCPINSYIQETDSTGALLSSGKICAQCAASAFKGPASLVSKCQRCSGEGFIYNNNTNPFSCVCDFNGGYTQAGSVCILTNVTSSYSQLAQSANSITYFSVESANRIDNTVPVTSQTFQNYYLQAVVGCTQYDDPIQCQVLANLCVLQFYL